MTDAADAVHAVLTALLLLAVGVAVVLALRAVRHWHRERLGRAYELPVDRRGTLLRAGASGGVALLAALLAVPVLHGPAARAPAAAAPAKRVAATLPEPVPSPPARTPEPAPPPPEVRTLGHPAGGLLQVLRDGTRVWLPPRYDSARAAGLSYPVVLVHAAADDPDLYPAFARQADRGLADSFLLVSPPSCGPDQSAVLAEVSRRYRALTARAAHAVVGIGPQAPCAVHEALAHPDRYRAGAGVSGRYPPLPPPAGPYPALLLAAASGETAARASALRLRTSLRPVGDQVRLIDGVAKRRDLLGLVDSYLTEKLDGPARLGPPTAAPSPGTPHGGSPSRPHAKPHGGSPSRPRATTHPRATPGAHTSHPNPPHPAPARPRHTTPAARTSPPRSAPVRPHPPRTPRAHPAPARPHPSGVHPARPVPSHPASAHRQAPPTAPATPTTPALRHP